MFHVYKAFLGVSRPEPQSSTSVFETSHTARECDLPIHAWVSNEYIKALTL